MLTQSVVRSWPVPVWIVRPPRTNVKDRRKRDHQWSSLSASGDAPADIQVEMLDENQSQTPSPAAHGLGSAVQNAGGACERVVRGARGAGRRNRALGDLTAGRVGARDLTRGGLPGGLVDSPS